MSNLLAISRQLWQATLERNIEKLSEIVHEKAMFVHMGATFNREQEFAAFRDGVIIPKEVNVKNVSLQEFDNTAIVLTQLTLKAEVNGNEVENPFVVTEVYQQQTKSWLLISLAYTRIVY